MSPPAHPEYARYVASQVTALELTSRPGKSMERAAGLCEACGYRRRAEAAITEAGLVAAAWSADLGDPDDITAVTGQVRTALSTDIKAARQQLLELVEPGELEANPSVAASALAFAALRAVEQALPEYRSSALAWLGRTEEAEAEARRAYETEQGRRWYRHNLHGADAVRRRRPPRRPATARPSTC